jgi:hypothetical protein
MNLVRIRRGWVDPGARQVERTEDGVEEAEATQTATTTWWGRRGRPAGSGVVLRREMRNVATALQEGGDLTLV